MSVMPTVDLWSIAAGALSKHTDTANDKGNHEPCPGTQHLRGMQAGRDAEEDDEDDGRGHGGVIIVVLEAR